MERNGMEWLAMAFARGDGADVGELREALERALDASSRVVRSRHGALTVAREGPPLSDAERFVEAIRAGVAAELADASVSAGLAVPRRRGAGLTTSALQAEQALLLGRALRGEGRTTAFADLGPYCFVLGQPVSDLRQFCGRVLGPLASEDDERHDDLVRTLEAYLQSHGSLNAAARALFLHRNTVRQRLRRIAHLTGADLNDAESRLALHLAVLGRRALAEMYAR
jgi:purine catabolism regulator